MCCSRIWFPPRPVGLGRTIVGLLLCLYGSLAQSAAAELRTGFALLHGEWGGIGATVFYQKLRGEIPEWEATLPVAAPSRAVFLLAPPLERSRLAVALANPTERPLAVVLQWNGSASSRRRRTLEMAALHQTAGHVDEWLPDIPRGDFGILQLSTEPSFGDGGFGAVGLLEWRNPGAPSVYTSLPHLGEEDLVVGNAYFPHVGAGRFSHAGQSLVLETHLYLFNPSAEPWTGTLTLRDARGDPLDLLDGSASRFVELGADDATAVLISSEERVRVGWVELVPFPGSPPLGGWSLFLYRDESGTRTLSAAVTALTPALPLPGTIPVEESRARTGVAAVNPTGASCSLQLELRDRRGRRVGHAAWQLDSREHSARFLDELFPGFPRGFQGTVSLSGSCPTALASFRLNRGTDDAPLLSAVPVWRKASHTGGDLIVPHIVETEGFKSALYLAAPENAPWSGRMSSFTPSGDALRLTWSDQDTAELPFEIPAGGFALLVPGAFLHLSGAIQATGGRSVAGAEVRVAGSESTAVTDSGGRYHLVLLRNAFPRRELQLAVTAPGYQDREISVRFDVTARQVVVDVILPPASEETDRAPRIPTLQLDLPSETVIVELQPALLLGTFTVTARGPGGAIELATEWLTAGRQHVAVDLAKLTRGEYEELEGRWQVGGLAASYREPVHFKVLGDFLHTRYNIPSERDCTGRAEAFCFTKGDCTLTDCALRTDGSGKSQWIAEVEENGSGFSDRWAFVTLEWFCPAPGWCTHKFRRLGAIVGCPACPGGYLEAGRTVAVRPDHPDLQCGDWVWVRGVGVLQVTDTGLLPRYDQLDHFAGVSGCDVPVSLGPRLTIKLDAEAAPDLSHPTACRAPGGFITPAAPSTRPGPQAKPASTLAPKSVSGKR